MGRHCLQNRKYGGYEEEENMSVVKMEETGGEKLTQMKNHRWKKILLRTGAAIVVIVLLYVAWQDRPGEPALKVITQNEENKTEYSVVYRDGRLRKTKKFLPDKVELLYAANEDFSSEIKPGGGIKVSLKATKMTDEKEQVIETDATVKAILQKVADEMEHDIFDVAVIADREKYFVFLKENVNLWTPCILYQYDVETTKLTKLYTWDSVELKGIAL